MSCMEVNQIRFLLFCSLCTLLILSCVSDAEINQDSIYGNWEVIAAKRNNRLTSTLKDGYFKFQENGQMETNIYGEVQYFQMTIENDVIEQTGDMDASYKIRMLKNDTLHISSTIQKYYFDFLAVKRDSLAI